MSLCTSVFKALGRVSIVKNSILLNKYAVLEVKNTNFIQEREFRKAWPTVLRLMKKRRLIAGPPKLRKRSDWFEWNYDAELYGFNKRLYENITDETLRCIFTQESYVRQEEQKRKDMVGPDMHLELKSNAALSSYGQQVMSDFLKRYLRVAYKYVPEEGICAVHDFLISEAVLSHISGNLGTKELIFSTEYPPNASTHATTLKAIIGGIATDDSVARAENFVLDFVCPQLIGKDVFEMWEFDEPLQILNSILNKQGREPAEARLIRESGRNTIEAVYHVGLYSNKQFLGKGIGETVSFAEEMAAYDALRVFFRVRESEPPLPLGDSARKLNFKSESENIPLKDMCGYSLS